MEVEPTEPRTPKPGDPFARSGGRSARRASQPEGKKKRHKKGRGFFLFLLITGGMLVLASLIVVFAGRGMILNFYKEIVVPRGIPEALAPDVPESKAKELVNTLHDYFEITGAAGVGDDKPIEMITRIEAALADKVLTGEEADSLITLADSHLKELREQGKIK